MMSLRNKMLTVTLLFSSFGFAHNTEPVVTPSPINSNPSQPVGSIDHVEITYSIILNQGGNAPIGDRMAAIGGYVDFTGTVPYVTISIGGQEYTAPTDANGNFSFLVFANANSFTATAWDPITGRTSSQNQNTTVTRSL